MTMKNNKKGGKRINAGAKKLPYRVKRITLGVKEEYYLYYKNKWTKELENSNAGTRKKIIKNI